MNANIIVINEQHKLLPEQESLLKDALGAWEVMPVPATGWNSDQMDDAFRKLALSDRVVFVSPVPLLLARVAFLSGCLQNELPGFAVKVGVFHNEKREAKEVNGRIIHVLAPDGWELRWLK